MTKLNTVPILEFKTAKAFEAWLIKNHDNSNGLWLKIFKKDSRKKTISHAEALDVALCYGWIDGQKQAHDEQAWLQKFCPRRAKSIWSKINTGHVQRLINEGRMRPAGLKAVEKAKADGSWEINNLSQAFQQVFIHGPIFLRHGAQRLCIGRGRFRVAELFNGISHLLPAFQ